MGQLIVVAGSLGAGKSTLTRALANRFGGVAYSEIPDQYPYLVDMYSEMTRWCFHNQLSFMVKKAEEHVQIQGSRKFGIQDRGIMESHEVFSRTFRELGVLSARDYKMLDRTLAAIGPSLLPPDLVIFMHAPVPFLTERVIMRDRSGETAIWPGLMEELNRQYERWYNAITTKHLRLDMTHIDFVLHPGDLDDIYSQVTSLLIEPFSTKER
jgi:deoxyadenosine/deoxycytidine kinase